MAADDVPMFERLRYENS